MMSLASKTCLHYSLLSACHQPTSVLGLWTCPVLSNCINDSSSTPKIQHSGIYNIAIGGGRKEVEMNYATDWISLDLANGNR